MDSLRWEPSSVLTEHKKGVGAEGGKGGVTWSLLPRRISPRRLLDKGPVQGQRVPLAKAVENHLKQPMEVADDGQESNV